MKVKVNVLVWIRVPVRSGALSWRLYSQINVEVRVRVRVRVAS